MAFLVYNKQNGMLIATGETFSLAGYNLIYRLWEKRGKPTEQGWHVSANDLIKIHTKDKESYKTRRLLIDFHPNAKWRIGIIELLDIYVYTYPGAKRDDAGWSPMMLRFRDVMYEEFENEITKKDKEIKINKIQEPDYQEDFVEFLYLNGTDKGWNWGINGMTNAAFIQGPARDYFRQYF